MLTTVVVAVAAGACGSTSASPHAKPTPSGAPLIPARTAPPTVSVSDVLPKRLTDLAHRAERIAGKTPPQTRPTPVDVAPGSTIWRPGTTYRGTFADPDIVRVRGGWLAYGTNTGHQSVPVLQSKDLTHWTALTNAMPTVGGWVASRVPGHGLWAPSVARVRGRWIAAYAAPASERDGRYNCIGMAVSSAPAGPFTPSGDPVCDSTSRLGVIDPDIYVDRSGTPWLLWKYSGIAGHRRAGIYVRQLDGDGIGFAAGSQTRELIQDDQAWEGITIENPSMIEFRGVHYLFYSGNSWRTSAYATGYAICKGPLGPCARPGNGLLLASNNTGNLGPGGASAFLRGSSLQLLYHAWDPAGVGARRRLHVAGLWQKDDGTLQLVDAG